MKKYYTHIEALRGIAILLVVLYHLAPKFCPYGFFGVDIFLMISGFLLIPGLLKNGGNDFSLIQFFNKKILRIFPPLLCMVVIMLIICVWCMASSELKQATETAFYALLGSSNVFLDSTTQGYFSTDSWVNPFVHTWYLSVILQVYCIFAITTYVLKPFSSKVKWGVVFLMGGVSVGMVVYYRYIVPLFTPHEGLVNLYYLTWTRIFEVVGGACIALLPGIKFKYVRILMPVIALTGIICCCFASEKSYELALILSALLLWGQTDKVTAWFTDNALFRFIGKYSFSIYLWHWPIIVYCNYAIESVSVLDKVLVFILSVLLGIASYYVTEKRHWKLWSIVLLWSISLIFAYILKSNENISKSIYPKVYEVFTVGQKHTHMEFVSYYPAIAEDVWEESGMREKTSDKGLQMSRLGSQSAQPSFVMVGDRHAGAFISGMAEIASSLNVSGYYIPIYVTPFHNRMCGRQALRFSEQRAKAFLHWLEKHPEIVNVVLVQRWSIRLTDHLNDESMPLRYDETPVQVYNLYEDAEKALEQFCVNLKNIGKQVVIMTEVPPVKANPGPYVRRALLHNHRLNMDDLTCAESDYYAMFSRQLMTMSKLERKGVCKVISIHKRLFKGGAFCAFENNKVLMSDDDHISDCGAVIYAREYYADWAPHLVPQHKEDK